MVDIEIGGSLRLGKGKIKEEERLCEVIERDPIMNDKWVLSPWNVNTKELTMRSATRRHIQSRQCIQAPTST